ncbi:Ribokinase-like protein [Microdochium trichocladiopsis]|uniref:pyridoxal kinase n=1 Tax=Microdochium trichocladiopsis TaxID=1682393 RepID=A0A9P8Y8F6_9PEZI|nr:Ribokinase-like protein [Microdochium trichocladiopsis]KAH7034879.1 Ribokinase-like protein [Microdochium trichocladiopsis]
MGLEPPVPETSVLAVASHVVSGNVGNKIAVFTLQSMGCEVAALNTVQFSNHTGYRQWKGARVSAQEITDLWDGLKQSYLDDFDMMLSGYVPGAAAVEAVGNIAKELRAKSTAASGKGRAGGRFFWVLDPVMGDNGKIYVAEDVVPAYRGLVPYADLILPNQFEAELLSDVKITDSASLEQAIHVLHERYQIPHIVITSVSLPLKGSQTPSVANSRAQSPVQSVPPSTKTMSVVGSSMTSALKPRLFKIHFPVFDGYFSGTGDMFAALMVTRMREAVYQADSATSSSAASSTSSSAATPSPGDKTPPPTTTTTTTTTLLRDTPSWLSPDSVDVLDLPLVKAAEKVLASMHEVLARTCASMVGEVERAVAARGGPDKVDAQTLHLVRSRAAELRLARNLECLRNPEIEYRAEKM